MSKIIEIGGCFDCTQREFCGALDRCTDTHELMKSKTALPDCPLPDKDEWITVSERLPEKGKCVQIWREGLSIIPTNAYLYEYWINNTGLILDDVTHWRLLPEPPK